MFASIQIEKQVPEERKKWITNISNFDSILVKKWLANFFLNCLFAPLEDFFNGNHQKMRKKKKYFFKLDGVRIEKNASRAQKKTKKITFEISIWAKKIWNSYIKKKNRARSTKGKLFPVTTRRYKSESSFYWLTTELKDESLKNEEKWIANV